MKESIDIIRIRKKLLELSEMKVLKGKHFIKKDRDYLNRKISSFGKQIQKILKDDLKKTNGNLLGLKDSKKEIEKVSKLVDEVAIEMNQKLKAIESQKKLVEEQRIKLSRKKKLLDKKLDKVKGAVLRRKKEVALMKNLKKKF